MSSLLGVVNEAIHICGYMWIYVAIMYTCSRDHDGHWIRAAKMSIMGLICIVDRPCTEIKAANWTLLFHEWY